ncbi:MAG: complex I NDUFA9 subunit family protein [Pseudomonadota bacterium]
MKKILVLGGSGFVGSHVCEKLARQQWRVTLPTRRRVNARHLQMLPLLDVIEADVHDEAALTRLVAGHDAVVNLVAILHGNEKSFQHAHVTLPQKLARACAAAGVPRVVHISALGADANGPSIYQRSKAAGEQVLQSAGLALTLLRPSVVFGAEDSFLNLFARLQRVFPVMPLAGSGCKFQPVWVEDVAEAVVRCLQENTTAGKTFEVCGPETFTLKELVQIAGRLGAGHGGEARPVLPLPLWAGNLQALLMELAPGQPLMSRDNLASLQVDNIASGMLPGLDALGITPESLLAVAPTYLAQRGPRSSLLALRKTAGRF